jgi:hypothetical protein
MLEEVWLSLSRRRGDLVWLSDYAKRVYAPGRTVAVRRYEDYSPDSVMSSLLDLLD